MQHGRTKVIIGNWKMNKSIAETHIYVSGLGMASSTRSCQVGLAVPFTMISAAAEAAKGTAILIGGQNGSDHEEGAFTGEVSCFMLKDAGASFVLIGHSERRQLFHEDNDLVNRKVKMALRATIRPVICVGETEEQHQSGHTHSVLHTQLIESLNGLTPDEVGASIIAYEPVWAIGTGKSATPEIVEATHLHCRSIIAKEWGKDTADRVTIQYGGSVKPENAETLLRLPNVDGLLVGGASLTVESFNKILSL
ncbi:MAG: triose-phosphate isomerase [Parachlamydiaceae bacterium]